MNYKFTEAFYTHHSYTHRWDDLVSTPLELYVKTPWNTFIPVRMEDIEPQQPPAKK